MGEDTFLPTAAFALAVALAVALAFASGFASGFALAFCPCLDLGELEAFRGELGAFFDCAFGDAVMSETFFIQGSSLIPSQHLDNSYFFFSSSCSDD